MTFNPEATMQARHAITQMGGKDVFAKTRAFQLILNPIKETGYFPYYLPLDSNEGTIAYFEGEKVFMLGSNNYLGLTSHPKVREASIEAIRKYGTSLTGSRFLNGSIKMHEEFEGELAEPWFLPRDTKPTSVLSRPLLMLKPSLFLTRKITPAFVTVPRFLMAERFYLNTTTF